MDEALRELRGCGSGVGSGVDSGSRSSEDSGSVVGQARFDMRLLSASTSKGGEGRNHNQYVATWPWAFLPCPQDNSTVFHSGEDETQYLAHAWQGPYH